MNDLDLDPQLEGRLRHTFETVAASTPIDDTPWSRVRREVEGRPGPARWLAAVAAALLLVVGAVGVWRITTRPDRAPAAQRPPRIPLTTPPPPIDPPAPVAPEGEEYPIERTGPIADFDPAVFGWDQVVDASSLRYWRTADSSLFSFRTVTAQSDVVVEWSCNGESFDQSAGMGCGSSLEMSVRPNEGTSWQGPNGRDGRGLWRWANVPAETDFVQYRVGDLALWQRPVDGMAAFPAATQTNDGVVAIAYRADGAVLGRVDPATTDAAFRRADELFPELGDRSTLDEALEQKAVEGVTGEFAACLRDLGVEVRGADGGTLMAQTAAGQDIEPAWQACIADTQEWLDDFVAEHS